MFFVLGSVDWVLRDLHGEHHKTGRCGLYLSWSCLVGMYIGFAKGLQLDLSFGNHGITRASGPHPFIFFDIQSWAILICCSSTLSLHSLLSITLPNLRLHTLTLCIYTMHHLKLYIGIAIYSLVATALPLRSAERSISPVDLDTIVKVALAPRQSSGAYKTGVPGGEFDDPDPPDDDNGDDDDDDDVMPEAFLESDADAGGESAVGNDAVAVASGLTGQGGVGSTALNDKSQGATSVFCSLFACAAAAESDGKVTTAVSSGSINATGPLIQIKGPLITIKASKKETKYVYNYYGTNGTSTHNKTVTEEDITT